VAREVQVLADSPDRLAAVALEAPGAVVAAHVDHPGSAAPGARVAVAILPDAPLGAFRETVAVRIGTAGGAAILVPVVGVVDEGTAPSDEVAR
jgi:hypothetical protein